MGYGLLFPGQGMQHAAMLPWLQHDALVAQTCAALEVSDWRQAQADPDWAYRNLNAQRLLTGLGLAAWGQLAPALPPPLAVAGYSVGELASFAAAGVLDAPTALALAAARARAMDRCAGADSGGLLAVSGVSAAQLAPLCLRFGLAVAIENDSHAHVLGGPLAALDQAAAALQGQGAHCTRLHVGLASHTHWMAAAAAEFARVLATCPMRAPRVALFCNAVDRVSRADEAAAALGQQIAQTVRWSSCMENIHARRVRCVLEVGPGTALARMWNQRYPDIPARSADEFSAAASLVAWVQRHCAD